MQEMDSSCSVWRQWSLVGFCDHDLFFVWLKGTARHIRHFPTVSNECQRVQIDYTLWRSLVSLNDNIYSNPI